MMILFMLFMDKYYLLVFSIFIANNGTGEWSLVTIVLRIWCRCGSRLCSLVSLSSSDCESVLPKTTCTSLRLRMLYVQQTGSMLTYS